jgi:DNA replication licensing factor MCM6
MSSLLDAVLNSDAAPTPSSDAGGGRRPPQMRSSSARPRGPPSESAGANSDFEGFADDEVVGARVPGRRNAPRTDIPRVVDVTGETLSLRFQEFLERQVRPWRLL